MSLLIFEENYPRVFIDLQVPEAWYTVHLQQGILKKNLIAQKEGSIAFVQYRVMPNALKIMISKSN